LKPLEKIKYVSEQITKCVLVFSFFIDFGMFSCSCNPIKTDLMTFITFLFLKVNKIFYYILRQCQIVLSIINDQMFLDENLRECYFEFPEDDYCLDKKVQPSFCFLTLHRNCIDYMSLQKVSTIKRSLFQTK